ncbi:hypothetical protein FQN60_009666 [Etheostoma spectabile]|uniref:Uncharacterized protein n=1 Tax=Etheostoma spectabile TaxID=54343 RepID=A0A5J5DK31_9PERO|nr:hypothetical protein FQN60_009666 [Etheostoma spectabile]
MKSVLVLQSPAIVVPKLSELAATVEKLQQDPHMHRFRCDGDYK